MKRRSARSFLIVIALSVCALLSAGCGGGGGGGGSGAGSAAIAGKVADGYVSGAAVTVYSDMAMATQIGSGTTDGSGNFSITLTVTSTPSTIYIKTTGGIDTSTGLPAATMFFAGAYSAGKLNVTPITTQVMKTYLSNQSAGLDAAQASVANSLGISTTDVNADVVTNGAAQSAMYQVLSTGNTGGTLPDSTYNVSLIFFENADVGNTTVRGLALDGRLHTWSNLTIANGLLSGTADNGDPVSGVVKGSTIVITQTSSTGSYGLTMAGEMNLGSASGTFTRTTPASDQAPNGSQATGLFLATFTPSTITAAQTANLYTALENIFQGTHYFAAADFLRSATFSTFASNPLLNYGQVTITPGSVTTGGFTFSGFTATGVTGRAVSGSQGTVQTQRCGPRGGGSASFLTGSRIFAFSQPYANGVQTLYVLGAIGNRNCIGFVVDGSSNIAKIVRITLVRDIAIAPVLQANTTYWRYEATASAGLIDQSRSALVPGGSTMQNKVDGVQGGPWLAYSHGSVVMPTLSGIGYGATSPNNTADLVFVGGTVMQEKIVSTDFGNTALQSNENIQALNLYEGGAMSGTQTSGGITAPVLPNTNIFLCARMGLLPPISPAPSISSPAACTPPTIPTSPLTSRGPIPTGP